MKHSFTFLFLLPVLSFGQTNFIGDPNSTSPGAYNVLIGLRVGQAMAQNAWYNTFVGFQTGQNNTEGSSNTFLGSQVGQSNTTGSNNVFVGHAAGINNTTASLSTFIGNSAGFSNQTGARNTYVGNYAGYSNKFSSDNLAVGYEAGKNSTGAYNVFVGSLSGTASTTGKNNVFVGFETGKVNDYGENNVFTGFQAGVANTTGSYNMFSGAIAGQKNTTGSNNIFVGHQAGYKNTTGSNNIIIGPTSGTAVTDGSDNILIGYNTQAEDNLQNATAIGANALVAVSNALVLGHQVNVGIGTSAPSTRLEVVSETPDASGLRLTHLTTTSPSRLSTDEFLTVNGQGDVVKARYLLRINKTSEWSDNVFAPAYQLRPLESVASYIGRHGHLPGIPSAEQVVREGVDLANLNATLLEKIEELTLYSIQLQKANQRQQSELDELKGLVKQFMRKK